MVTEQECIKVCLTNQGSDTETPWAQDLGPVAVPPGGRKVRLVNIPFFHAKPTWGDVIIVGPAKGDGYPTWDRAGTEWKSIATRIVEDGGRWVMIVAYTPTPDASEEAALDAFGAACRDLGIVWENAPGTGRVYLAAPKTTSAEAVMSHLDGLGLPLALSLVHPVLKRPVRAQTVVGVTPEAPRRPARARTERGDDSAPTPPVRTRATTNPPARPGKLTSSSTAMAPVVQEKARAKTAPSELVEKRQKAAKAAPAAKTVATSKAAAVKAAPPKAAAKPAPPAKSKAAPAPAKKSVPSKAAASSKAKSDPPKKPKPKPKPKPKR